MKRVLSIDIGTKNFCYCYYDAVNGKVLDWKRLSLPPKGKMLLIPRLVTFLHEFQTTNRHLTEEADLIAVEQQMTSSMRIMEAVLYSQYFGRAKSFNPRTVKKYWRTVHPDECPVYEGEKLTRNVEYRLGKRMAVNIVKKHFTPLQNPEWKAFFDAADKKDDLADSLLQAVYAVRHC